MEGFELDVRLAGHVTCGRHLRQPQDAHSRLGRRPGASLRPADDPDRVEAFAADSRPDARELLETRDKQEANQKIAAARGEAKSIELEGRLSTTIRRSCACERSTR
jgi:hypothetical protein